MADMTRLLRALQSYAAELDKHNARVSAAFTQLERSRSRLNTYYEGAGAKDFKAHFARTERGLHEYVNGTRAIKKVLQERIDRLTEADRPGGLG